MPIATTWDLCGFLDVWCWCIMCCGPVVVTCALWLELSEFSFCLVSTFV